MKNELIELTETWQKDWHHMQDLINDLIKNKDYSGAYRVQCKSGVLKSCLKNIYSLLQSENTEGVSGSSTEFGVLPLVVECNAHGETDERNCEPEQGGCEKITHSENGCDYCLGAKILPVYGENGMNTMPCYCQKASMKE